MREFTVEKSGVDGHSNRAEAAIKKIEYFVRSKTKEIHLKYTSKLPVFGCWPYWILKYFCCMVLNFTPYRKVIIKTPNALNSVNLKMTLDDMIQLQFGQMCEVIITKANLYVKKQSLKIWSLLNCGLTAIIYFFYYSRERGSAVWNLYTL